MRTQIKTLPSVGVPVHSLFTLAAICRSDEPELEVVVAAFVGHRKACVVKMINIQHSPVP